MNVLRDMLATANDAIRLCRDVMQYKIEKETRSVKRRASRIGVCLGVGLIALGFVGAGMGLLLYGAFAMVAGALGPGPSGLIIGAASILFAGLLVLLACASVGRS
jgi:hypothetical protein